MRTRDILKPTWLRTNLWWLVGALCGFLFFAGLMTLTRERERERQETLRACLAAGYDTGACRALVEP
jgi:hypothetical protein